MKQLNKLLALALAVIMVMALATTAFAATITVNGAVAGQTYHAYKIFDVTVANISDTEQTYAYTIDSKLSDGTADNPWYSVVNTYAQTTSNGLTLTKVGDSSVYNVSVDNTFSAASFAAALSDELAKDTGTTKRFTASGNATAAQDQKTTINVSESGYYFVDSSVGALCVLNTVTDNFTICEKNSLPTIEKKVQEDSKTTEQDGGWGDSATADIGQTVKFKLTVKTGTNNAGDIPQIGTDDNAKSDAGVDKNYVIEDKMTKLTYTGDTNNGTTNASGADAAATVAVINGNTTWTIGTDFTVAWDTTSKKLTITLKASKLDDLPQDTEITVTYGAKLDEDAVVGTENNSNKNTVKLTYGTYSTTEVTTTVKTYKIDVFKFHETGEGDAATKNPLAGAKFTLSNKTSADGVDTYTPLYFKSPTTGTIYVHNSSITAADTGYVNEITTDNTTGKFSITGLDAGTYYLTETAAPRGFNQLKDRIEVTVGEDGKVTYKLPDTQDAVNEDTQYGILVENNAGSILPSTGGIGTTIFYVLGGILVVGAGVLLITKKRMSNSK